MGRAEELAARPKAIEKFRKALALAKKNATEVWPDERPWLEQEDLDALVKKADDAGAWLDDQEKAQKKLKNHEEPAFRVAELNAKLKPTVVLAARLNAKKKPVVIEANATNATDVNATDGNATDANATEPEAESEEDAKVTEEIVIPALALCDLKTSSSNAYCILWFIVSGFPRFLARSQRQGREYTALKASTRTHTEPVHAVSRAELKLQENWSLNVTEVR